jgi:hypothetical protein
MSPRSGYSPDGLSPKLLTGPVRYGADNTVFGMATGPLQMFEEAIDERHQVKGQRGLLSDVIAIFFCSACTDCMEAESAALSALSAPPFNSDGRRFSPLLAVVELLELLPCEWVITVGLKPLEQVASHPSGCPGTAAASSQTYQIRPG